MAITITAYSAGIDVTAYLNTFVSPNYSPVGFGYFSSNPNDFSGNQYAVTEQPNLIPDAGEQAIVFESGGGGNSIDYDFSTHIVSGDLDAISFGYGVTYDGGTDSFPLSQLDLRISGLGLVDQTGAGSMVEALLNDGRIASITNLSNLLASGAINFVGSTGSDVFTGYAQNDTMTGGGGNDTLNGSDGTDTAAYSGNRSDYTVTNNAGSWTITDNRGIDGSDTLSKTEFAQFADQTMALVGNAAPVASNDSGSTVKNISTVIDVLANDTDSDGTLVASTVAIVGGPAHGSVTIDTATGKITYTPTTNYVGADSFTYTVKDDDGTVSNQATVNVGVASGFTLTAGDDVFIADQKGYATALEIDGGAGNDYISTSNVPGGPGFPYADTVYGGEGNDLIITGSGNDFVDAGAGDDVIAARGGNETVIGGAGNDTFVLRFFRNAASATTDTGTTTITDNDGVLWNGSFRPDPYPAAWTPAPTATQGFAINGTATVVSAGVWDLAVTDDSAAIKHLTINWTGHDLTMTGGNETLVIKDYVNGTFGITLENAAPVASNDSVSTVKNINTVIDVLATDTDADGTLNPSTVAIVDGPDHGSVTIDTATGKITYTPTTNYAGADSFTYTVKDDDGVISNEATVNIGVASGFTLTAGDDVFIADQKGYATALEIDGGAGNDYISTSNVPGGPGFPYADTVYGGEGNDLIITGSGNDFVDAGAGDDVIAARGGNETVIGGAGNDTFVLRFFRNAASATTDTGTTTITDNDGVLWNGSFRPDPYPAAWTPAPTATQGFAINGTATVVSAGVWDLAVTDDSAAIKHLTINWTGHDLTMTGGNETLVIKDYVNGTFGITLENVKAGGPGNDTLSGSGGIYTMVGVAGDDTYFVDDTGDVVLENANEGNDVVHASINYTLTANVENLVLEGDADLQGYGNDLDNMLYGNVGNNLLNGGAGADVMLGGAGSDTYFVDNTNDSVVENASEGSDVVLSTANNALSANVEALVLLGTADLQGYGNSQNNVIYGNVGNNLLNGGAGVDLMVGGAGNDTYFADDSSDSAFEIAGEGNDAVFSTAHYGLAADVETLILLGSADLQGYGNNQVNTIYGNAGNNLLNGAGGADLMVGGAGDDTYFVDDISDSAFESPGEGNDAVFSTVHYGLAADVETLVLQGSADLQGYGSNQANTLYGNTGNNLLNGAGGADTMLGGADDDTYFVDDAGDVVFENPGEGTDAVFASVNCTLTANVEVLVLNGPGNLSGTGNALANSLFGNGGDNVLDGGAGVDVLQGNAGNDTFVFHIGEGGGDTVVDFAGNGAAAGDSLQFVGYGPGATFTNIDATHWQVNFNGGASHEIITFMNAASIDPTDYAFI